MPPRERCGLCFCDLACMVGALCLHSVKWGLTQRTGSQSYDPFLLRHRVKRVLDRCIEEPCVNLTFYVAFND